MSIYVPPPNAIKEVAKVIFSANAIGFVLSATFRTHVLTDLIGVGSFVLATFRLTQLQSLQKLFEIPLWDNRLLLLNSLVVVWGIRLSSYLFYRISCTKEDKRLAKFYPSPGEGYFDKTRSNFPISLATFWFLQSMWGFISMLPVTFLNGASLSITADHSQPKFLFSVWESINILSKMVCQVMEITSSDKEKFVFVIFSTSLFMPFASLFFGIIVESIADYQKYIFKSNRSTADHWCDVGLWKYSRFPNYFGEMMVWWSVYAITLPVFLCFLLEKSMPLGEVLSQIVLSALSPLFVSGLLCFLSGVPIHDRNNLAKYGKNKEYLDYLAHTPTIVPNFFAQSQRKSKST